MKWFGRKGVGRSAASATYGEAGRETARPFLLQGATGGVAGLADGTAPRSYEAQVREAYFANPVARRAVTLVAEGLASVVVYDRAEASSQATAATAAPADRRSGSIGTSAAALVTGTLLETVATQLLLHGNSYVQVLPDDRGEAAELFALRPERVAVETDAGGWPLAYLYKAGEARSRIAAADPLGRRQVAHLKASNPLDDHYGLGCLAAAAGAVGLHNRATRWSRALLDNAARPSGALVYAPEDGAALSSEQHERLRTEMETTFSGAANAGRPMLLEGGLRWQAMSLTPADMDFAGLKATAAREIALAFGVPPMLLGLPGDAAYANHREANRALWRQTILPMAGRVLEGLSAALDGWWPGCRLAADVDQIGALAEERERLWAAVGAAEFLSRDEKREMLGFAASAEASAERKEGEGHG